MTPSAVPVCAPGKLFVLGEYAVLGGGPALVTSVDRHVHVRPRDDRDGYCVEGANFDDPLHLPLLIREVLGEHEGLDVDLNRLTVDVGELFRDGTKLGLGSSAASTAALVASTAPTLDRDRQFEIAHRVHREFQGGVGSGADIAVSTFGGPLVYHLEETAPPFDELDLGGLTDLGEPFEAGPATLDTGVDFPDDIRIDAVWTGHHADSSSFVRAVGDRLREAPRQTARRLTAAARAARAGIKALRNGASEDFVDAVREGDRAMEQLGADVGVPVITDIHRRIRALAHTTHAVAKPSGAGGGDFTLLVGPADAPVPSLIDDEFFTIPVHAPQR